MLNELNDIQRQAVVCYDTPSLVIAGAGSGKTRVLTYKIAYMLQQGIMPWNILALTFTNKAAREMRDRIQALVGNDEAQRLWMGTFHSIFARILRREAECIGMQRDFTIYDAADSKSLIKSIVKELGYDEKQYKPASVANRISTAKNALVGPDAYPGLYQASDMTSSMPNVWRIYQEYARRCRLANAMDFDDLLFFTYRLLSEHPEVRKKYEEQFRYVLVDEYQDTNYAQHQIVWLLTEHNQRLCVVGDDSQSIYSFRGANIENILQFRQHYPTAQLFKLERNYRSTQTIVEAANSVIRHNRHQIEKSLYSENGNGKLVQLVEAISDIEESNSVTRRISVLHNKYHVPYEQIAVLYRTNSQSRQFEESLIRECIPYRIYGGLSFYQRKEIKDVIAYLRLAVNPNDEEALKRVINYPARGIGDTTLRKVFEATSAHQVTPMDVVSNPAGYGLTVNKGTATKLQQFALMIDDFRTMAVQANAEDVARHILGKSGLAAEVNRGTDPEDLSRQENVRELVDAISAFVVEKTEQGLECRLTDFLQEVSLMSDLDDTPEKQESAEGFVTLMTIHASKGLEFRIVFVVGLEETLFPNQMALDEGPRGLEEERRLMYVAMTRASEELILTSCRNRFRYGRSEMMEPSRFLREIDSRLIERKGSVNGASNHGRSNNYSSFTSSSGSRGGSYSSHFSSGEGRSSASSYGASTRTPFGEPPFGRQSAKSQTTPPPSSVRGKTLKRVQTSSVPPAAPPQTTAPSSSVGSSSPFCQGQRVEHARFGKGTIRSIEGTGADIKAVVEFENCGTKQLLLRYAKLTVL